MPIPDGMRRFTADEFDPSTNRSKKFRQAGLACCMMRLSPTGSKAMAARLRQSEPRPGLFCLSSDPAREAAAFPAGCLRFRVQGMANLSSLTPMIRRRQESHRSTAVFTRFHYMSLKPLKTFMFFSVIHFRRRTKKRLATSVDFVESEELLQPDGEFAYGLIGRIIFANGQPAIAQDHTPGNTRYLVAGGLAGRLNNVAETRYKTESCAHTSRRDVWRQFHVVSQG